MFKMQVKIVGRRAFGQINIQLFSFLNWSALIMVTYVLVSSQLDHCNT